MMKGRGRGTLLEPISDFTLQKDALEYLNAEKETRERGETHSLQVSRYLRGQQMH